MKNYFFGGLIVVLLAVFSSFYSGNKRVVVIDPGHGGQDKGAVVKNAQEQDITLAIAKKIQQLNKDKNLEIVLTREDTAPSLGERAALINRLKPEFALSLHVNFHPKNTDRSGVELYTQNTDRSKNLAEELGKKLDAKLIKEQNLYLLRNSDVPVVLVETGFLSNAEEHSKLTSEAGQTEIAEKILDFLYEAK